MATYISLVQFTDKGIQAAKETTQRVADWASKVESRGVSIREMYWTLGQYDQVCVFDAPDDETAASVLLVADMLGNIRTADIACFHRAAEMEKILARCPDQDEVDSGIAGPKGTKRFTPRLGYDISNTTLATENVKCLDVTPLIHPHTHAT